MFRRVTGAACLALLTPGTMLVADTPAPAPPAVEAALRAKVSKFYQLLIDKHYRQAEELVAPDSRDDYYNNEKPNIEDFTIKSIAWKGDFKKADVTIESNFRLRTPRGEYTSKLPYVGHWAFENGDWYWYFSHDVIRSTAFGMMRVNPEKAKDSGLNLKEMIAKGPSADQLNRAIQADKTSVKLSDSTEPVRITLASTFPGIVRLKAFVVAGSGFGVKLNNSDLKTMEKTELVISRVAGKPFQAGHVDVVINPTLQVLDIKVD